MGAERRKRTTTMLAKGCAGTGAGALMEHRFARGTPLSRGGAPGAAAVRSRKSGQVHAGKAAKKMGGMNRRYRQSGMMQQQRYQEPPIDPDNEEFVLFARSTEDPFPTWYPVTILQGGSQANLLVRARENEITKMLTGNTLAKSLGVTLYKEREKVEDMARKNQPFLKKAKTMEFALKVRQKDVPKSWMKADKTLDHPAGGGLQGHPGQTPGHGGPRLREGHGNHRGHFQALQRVDRRGLRQAQGVGQAVRVKITS